MRSDRTGFRCRSKPHLLHGCPTLQGIDDEEPVPVIVKETQAPKPGVVVVLRQIRAARIRKQNDDDVVAGQFGCNPEAGGNRQPRRSADQQSLFPGERSGSEDGVTIRYGHKPIDQLRVERLWPNILG